MSSSLKHHQLVTWPFVRYGDKLWLTCMILNLRWIVSIAKRVPVCLTWSGWLRQPKCDRGFLCSGMSRVRIDSPCGNEMSIASVFFNEVNWRVHFLHILPQCDTYVLELDSSSSSVTSSVTTRSAEFYLPSRLPEIAEEKNSLITESVSCSYA